VKLNPIQLQIEAQLQQSMLEQKPIISKGFNQTQMPQTDGLAWIKKARDAFLEKQEGLEGNKITLIE